MSTLFQALLSQHARSLRPMRYAEPMTVQLQNFFEEVVLENSLQALVVESLPAHPSRTMREIERVRRIGDTARFPYFLVSPNDELMQWYKNASGETTSKLTLLSNTLSGESVERFVVIADTHFSGLLVAIDAPKNDFHAGQQVIYTFDPDVVYTALEYLGARFAVEYPMDAQQFMNAVHRSMPKATSLHLTLSVTTKLASLWQEQTGREIAVNRIATAIRQSLELDEVLQTAVNEVGAALGIKCCALLIESEEAESMSVVYFRQELPEDDCATIRCDLEAYKRRLKNHPQNYVRDGYSGADISNWADKPQIVVPLSFLGQFVGVLFVQADQQTRIWQESEILLLQTVADQAAIAIKHARLYVKSQQEALRDGLTGIFNRRFFEMQFDREFRLAERKNSTFAVMLIDIDKFKLVNDTYGHTIGDSVLRHVAQLLKSGLRAFDTLARFGGEEFVVILPQITAEDAQSCAERLRRAIENLEIPEAGQITASFGIAVYPETAETMPELLKSADQALYRAKREGRNLVRLAAREEKPEPAEKFFHESPAIFAV